MFGISNPFGGGGIEIGRIFASVGADLSDFDRGMLEASTTMRATAASMKSTGDGIGRDAERMAKRSKNAWRDSETGLLNFDRAAKGVSRTLSGGPFGLFGGMGNVAAGALRLGGLAQSAANSFGQWALMADQSGGALAGLGSAMTSVAPLLGVLVSGSVAFGAALLVLPALIGAVTFALVFLLDAATTLAAIIGGLVAPLSLTIGLLGGLGAAFAYTASQAFKAAGTAQDHKDALLKLHSAQQTYNQDLAKYGSTATQTENALVALHAAQEKYKQSQLGLQLSTLHLQDKFGRLTSTLAHDFMPLFVQLGQAAATALTYLDKIAHMPLDKAFKSLGSQGVHMLNEFVQGVAGVLANPVRLAIKVGFGSPNIKNAVTSWWKSFNDYLWGYTKTQTFRIGAHMFADKKQVKGALDPIVKWFSQQHFTQTGIRWSNEIINGFLKSGAARNLSRWASTAANHAGHVAGHAFMAALGYEILHAIPNLISWMGREFENLATRESNWQMQELGRAWDWIKSKVSGIWNDIVALIENPLSIHISWPSPPGWVSSLIGGGGSLIGSAGSFFSSHIPHASGGIITRPLATGGHLFGEAGREAVLPLDGAQGRKIMKMLGGGGRSYGGGNAAGRGRYIRVFIPDSELSRITRGQSARTALEV